MWVIVMRKNIDYYDLLPEPKYSVKHRRRINRIFREVVCSSKIPHPEVDNWFEQKRSEFIVKLNTKNKTARK